MQANDTPAEGLSHEWKQPAKEIDQVRVISFGAKVKSVCVCVCVLADEEEVRSEKQKSAGSPKASMERDGRTIVPSL